MSDSKPDEEPAKKPAAPPDRGEPISRMEPLLIGESSQRRGELNDLAVELAVRAAGFRRALPTGVASALARLVRAMNCYYSNLIEGHDTHPIDIERALNGDYSTDPQKRDLQLEARAHIAVQSWIDEGGLLGRAMTTAGVCEIHRRFCELLPEDLLWARDPETGAQARVAPGVLRDHDVIVGRHVAVSPGALPRFMARFDAAYGRLGKVDSIIASATAHHRLLWIHPFADANGRVARLMSYAAQSEVLQSGGIWSIARGLARNEKAYKVHLSACDLERRNDLEGRGNLSEEALSAFAVFFLKTCIDQIDFMESLVQPDQLRNRIFSWAEEEAQADRLPPRSGEVLQAILFQGSLSRADVPTLLGASERQARRVTSALIDAGVLMSKSSRAPLELAFPAHLAGRWMPGLFPDKPR